MGGKENIHVSWNSRKSASRVASAYRTVSENATLAVFGIPPIELLTFERQYSYIKGKAMKKPEN